MPPLTLLIKPASSACNQQCKYCFYHKPPQGVMSSQTLERLVENALGCAEHSCTFAFQGGEPLLAGMDFYEALIALQTKYNTREIKIHNAMQTNGTLIDDRWAAFLKEHSFLVGLSLDGPRRIHNANRGESYEAAMFAANRLKKHGVDFNILCVVTGLSAREPQALWEFYRKHGFAYLQFIPCLDYDLRPGEYGKFLCRMFELWHGEYLRGQYVDVRFFANLVQMAAGYPPEACGMCGRCIPYPVIEADGGVYPCDFYVTPEWKLGTVEDDLAQLLQSDKARRFAEISYAAHEQCKTCPHGALCRGGCRRWREPGLGLNALCEDFRMFFERCGERIYGMAKML